MQISRVFAYKLQCKVKQGYRLEQGKTLLDSFISAGYFVIASINATTASSSYDTKTIIFIKV